MKTVTDYAAGMSGGTALSTQEIVDYTTNLAKMTTGAYDAMTKKGFVVTKAQKKILTTGTDMEKVAAIQEIIGESWGGMAESFVNTPTGKLAQMNNLFGDLKEKIGAVFSGKYVSLLGMFTDTLSSLNDIMSDGFQDSDIGDIANTVETLADKGIAGLNKYLPYFMNFAAMAISVLGKSLIKLAPTLAKSFANGLVMMFKSGAAVIKANGPELLSAIKDVVMTAVSGMYEMIVGQPMPEGMFSSIQNAAENVLDGIVGFASGVRDFVGGIISAAGPLIGGLLNLASGVFAFLGKNMDSILPILGFVAGSIMAVVTAQKLAAAATAIETAAQWALNSGLLLCPITRIVASIVALVAVLIIAYNKSETFRTIIDSLGRIIGWVVGKIGEFISGIVDWVKNCEPLQKILSGIKSALSWIGDKVGGVFKKAADGLSGFADSLDGGVAEAAGEKISSGVAKGIENGKGSVEASANDLKSSLSGTFGDLNIPSVDVGDMGIDFASVGTNSAMNFSSGFNAGLTELGGAQDVAVNLTVDQSGLAAASGAVNSFVAETQTAVGQIPQVFDTAMGTASQTVTAKLTEITTSVTSGMAACLSAVQNGLSQIIAAVSAVNLSSAGANMINGLVNGINSRKAAAVAAARGVATAVNAEFNKVQKISSPSKVWQEKGQFLIEGGIIGMEKTMPQMRDTAQAAGEMAIPYSQNYTPESGGGYSTVNSSSSETNNYSPTFNLTINGGSSSDRDLARRVKEWVKEAIADEFDSMSRKRPAPRLA